MSNNSFFDTSKLAPHKLVNQLTDDDKVCMLRFGRCHDNYPLEKLGAKELKALLSFLKKIEVMTWKEIKIDSALNYETPSHFNVSMPDFFPKDATPISMRVSKKFRIIGWREGQYLNIMWFDKNHNSYNG